MGVLISAIDCNFNCNNCFNQPLKDMPTQEMEVIDIINKVKSNPFNKGIILAGLEWTLQEKEMIELSKSAKEHNLITMVYTGSIFNNISDLLSKNGKYIDYIKCGQYIEELKTINHIEYGVALASSNQHIYKRGIDY